MKNIAVILASGSGSRFESKTPKQFVKLAGKPVIQYTIEAFQNAKNIDEIIIVAKCDYVEFVYELVNLGLFCKVSKVICGGVERFDSTFAAIQSIKEKECKIIIHDAVRPFISEQLINNCLSELDVFNAVDVVVDAVDTIVRVDNNFIKEIPDRRFLKRGQTPQAFKKSVLQKSYDDFMKDANKVASDDCGIVLKYSPDEKIKIINGDESNFKITHQQDIYLADNLIKDGLIGRLDKNPNEIAEKIKGKVIVVFGGGSGIGKDILEISKQYGALTEGFSRRLNSVDVTDHEKILTALKEVREKYGRIDFIVNTTGILNRKPLMAMSDEEVADSFNVNYVGVLNVARCSFGFLKETNGMLLNFSSSSYTRGRPNYSIYSSCKAAVVNLTQALAEEWSVHGIKVNVINPERTATPMRTENFGVEPPETLLNSKEVAEFSLSAMSFDHTGQVFTIRK